MLDLDSRFKEIIQSNLTFPCPDIPRVSRRVQIFKTGTFFTTIKTDLVKFLQLSLAHDFSL